MGKGIKYRALMALSGAVFKAKGAMMQKSDTKAAPGKIYEFSVKTIDGKDRKLSDYKGHVLMVVNTASLCGFTPQYDALETVFQKYKEQGFRVLAFPANEFGAQEPGGNAEIKEFCRMKFSIKFDLFEKIVVKGDGIHPLYKFLTTESGFNGPIGWNFAKFLVGKNGEIAGRFDPSTDPMGRTMTKKIEELLAA